MVLQPAQQFIATQSPISNTFDPVPFAQARALGKQSEYEYGQGAEANRTTLANAQTMDAQAKLKIAQSEIMGKYNDAALNLQKIQESRANIQRSQETLDNWKSMMKNQYNLQSQDPNQSPLNNNKKSDYIDTMVKAKQSQLDFAQQQIDNAHHDTLQQISQYQNLAQRLNQIGSIVANGAQSQQVPQDNQGITMPSAQGAVVQSPQAQQNPNVPQYYANPAWNGQDPSQAFSHTVPLTAFQQQMIKEREQTKIDNQKKVAMSDQYKWQQVIQKLDPATASGRSAIGMVGRTNNNIKRALDTLNQPMVTGAMLGNIMGDLSSIYQNGSATDFGMKTQDYNTAYGNLQKINQYLSGNPTNALPPKIKQQIKTTLNLLQDTNKEILTKFFDEQEKGNAGLIERHPQEWNNFKQSVLINASSEQGTRNTTQISPEEDFINKALGR